MIESIFFLFGAGFSILVYLRSIRNTRYSRAKKAFFFLITFIGITGIIFLFGILVADRIRRMSAM